MTALVPAADTAALEPLDQQAREVAVTAYLTQARDQLAHAVEMTGPEAVAQLKAEIATAAEATKQLGLSKEIQQDAQEMVRRAEYALGKAIRAGQERGKIRSAADTHTPGVDNRVVQDNSVAKPTDFASKTELSGNGRDRSGIYALVDEVSEQDFEEALTDAKAEGNLSRANVVRKLKPKPEPEQKHRPDVLRKRRLIDGNRVIESTVLDASNVVSESLIAQIDFAELDREKLEEWISSLSESLKALRSLKTQLEKELHHG